MYTNCFYHFLDNKYYIFDENGEITVDSYSPYCYMKTEEKTDLYTITGVPVKKVKMDESYKKNPDFYEVDIHPEIRLLVDKYYQSDEIPVNRIMYLDIETSSEGGFPDVSAANRRITAISTKMNYEEKYVEFVLDKKSRFTLSPSETVKYIVCKSEKELLNKFVVYFTKIAKPSIVTGWNCFAFDMPYLYRRIARVLTKSVADSISPVGIVKDFKINFSLKNEVYDGIRIVGVSILDYMILYKKYSINERPMYKLDYIAKVELNRGKVEYEGSLDDLYNNDLNKYIEYNIEDIKIVVDLESKLHYIETAIGMCHKGCIPYDWVFMQSRIIEGAILKYFKLNNLVSTNKKEHGVFKFPGAYVKEPIPGRYKWIYSCDLVSLYPSIIRTLNLSTETKLGKILKEKDGKVEILLGNSNKIVDKSKFEKFLKDNKITRSTNGILYTTSKRGFIPKIIDMWFEERLKYKKLKSDAKKLGNKDDEKKYDIQQYVTKILLNSFYGVLGLSSFRFYDIDNAYAVTSTGQSIIQESDKKIREIYSTLGYDGDSPVAYGDTDSLYTTSYPLLKDKKLSNNDILHFTRCISNIVTNELNKNLKSFASDVLNSSNNFLKFNQEAVCYSVLWTGKKKYAMYILDDEGYVPTKNGNMPSGFKMPDISDLIQLRDYISSNKNISDGSVSFDSINPKFKVKGLDTVKSDFPNSFKNILKEVLISILQFKEKDSILHMIKDFKNSMENLDIVDISIPKGVRNIEGYYDPVSLYKKGAPIHVKSAINYNEFIKKYDLGNKYRFIDSGNKLKFVHLKQNEFNFDTIAFKDDIIPDELKFFIDKYIDRDSIFNSVLINKLQDFWGILGWGELTLVDTNLKKFF